MRTQDDPLPHGTKLQCPICSTLYLKGERHACVVPSSVPEGHKIVLDRDLLLVERQKTHGSFEINAAISQDIKSIFQEAEYNKLKEVHREALDMIALKLSRILSGQASFKDHWDDIAGYAKLGSEACD